MRRISIAIVMLAAAALGGCGARDLVPDAGGGGTTGTGGAGGRGIIIEPPSMLLSDFEDIAGATIVQTGYPPRNGFWYTYNDASPTCVQVPMPGMNTPYVGQAPPTGVADPSIGSFALHGFWSGCTSWGAGIGADINVPVTPDGGVNTGPKVPYDLTPYIGITFWARAEPGSDTQLRFKLPMRGETSFENGGTCTEEVTHKCGDDWGMRFTVPANGSWKQFTLLFSNPAFVQEGWGASYSWNPADVISIQIQAVDHAVDTNAALYDFWIDDIYLFR